MKIYPIILSLLFLSCTNTGSNNLKSKLDKIHTTKNSANLKKSKDSLISLLPYMKSDSLGCDADVYWRIIKRGKTSIPLLIESLTDTTITNVYSHCKNGKLNVAEVSYFALEELAEFPAFAVTKTQFDLIDENGCWSFFDYFFDNKNKKDYQKKVSEFYNTNKYVFVNFDSSDVNECRKKYKINGKLKWKE